MGVSAQELYKVLGVQDMPYSDWLKYIIDSGLEYLCDYKIQDDICWIEFEAAKEICKLQIYKIASEHDCFEAVFDAFLAQEKLDITRHNEKAKTGENYLNHVQEALCEWIGDVLRQK